MRSSSCIWHTSRTMGTAKPTTSSQVIEGYNQRTKAEAQVAPIYAIADALKAKKNSDATPNKPFDSFPDHNPMMDPDPEIDNAFQPPSFYPGSLPGF